MKKVFALALAAAMALSMVACGSSEPTEPEVTDVAYKTGMGIVVSPSLRDATADKAGQVQMNTTMCVATFDAEDKVVSVSFDVAQQAVAVNLDGTTGDAAATDVRTKMEKKGDYGMVGASPIGKELNEQVEALQTWCVGKTISEIVEMPVTVVGTHNDVPTDADLSAGCTISLTDYLAAIKEAHETAVETLNVAKTGMGQNTSVKATAATADKAGSVQVDTNVVGVALDAEGKIVWAKIDVAQNKAAFGTDGVIDTNVDVRTKVEKEGDYGMAGVSEIGKEYFEQVAALGEWMVGKTVADVVGMETFQRDESHTAVPAVEDLKASCTITVGSYLEALDEAASLAK